MGRKRVAVTRYPRYARLRGQRAHRVIVEQRTGIKLPETAVIHHCDPNDKETNRGPFVVCQDNAYHLLIEARTRALEACGNANWKKCRKCGQYDDPGNMQSKEVMYRCGPFRKYWHYRFKNQCVGIDHPVKHTRPHVPRKRKHVAPWRLRPHGRASPDDKCVLCDHRRADHRFGSGACSTCGDMTRCNRFRRYAQAVA